MYGTGITTNQGLIQRKDAVKAGLVVDGNMDFPIGHIQRQSDETRQEKKRQGLGGTARQGLDRHSLSGLTPTWLRKLQYWLVM